MWRLSVQPFYMESVFTHDLKCAAAVTLFFGIEQAFCKLVWSVKFFSPARSLRMGMFVVPGNSTSKRSISAIISLDTMCFESPRHQLCSDSSGEDKFILI